MLYINTKQPRQGLFIAQLAKIRLSHLKHRWSLSWVRFFTAWTTTDKISPKSFLNGDTETAGLSPGDFR